MSQERSRLLMGEDRRIQAIRDGKIDLEGVDHWMSKGVPTAPYAIFKLAPHYRIFLFSVNVIKLNNGDGYSAKVDVQCEGEIESAEFTGKDPNITQYQAWRDAIVKLIPKDHLDHIYDRERNSE